MMNFQQDQSTPPLRVMLIDDEEGFTKLLRINLENRGGFSVCEVNDPRMALKKAHQFQPDVILLDIVMPSMDGGDLVSLLESDETLKNTPVIFLTALLDNHETQGKAVRDSHGRVFLSKPVTFDTLLRYLRYVLSVTWRRPGVAGDETEPRFVQRSTALAVPV